MVMRTVMAPAAEYGLALCPYSPMDLQKLDRIMAISPRPAMPATSAASAPGASATRRASAGSVAATACTQHPCAALSHVVLLAACSYRGGYGGGERCKHPWHLGHAARARALGRPWRCSRARLRCARPLCAGGVWPQARLPPRRWPATAASPAPPPHAAPALGGPRPSRQ